MNLIFWDSKICFSFQLINMLHTPSMKTSLSCNHLSKKYAQLQTSFEKVCWEVARQLLFLLFLSLSL